MHLPCTHARTLTYAHACTHACMHACTQTLQKYLNYVCDNLVHTSTRLNEGNACLFYCWGGIHTPNFAVVFDFCVYYWDIVFFPSVSCPFSLLLSVFLIVLVEPGFYIGNLHYLAKTYAQLGQLDKQKEVLEKIVSTKPRNEVDVEVRMCVCVYEKEKNCHCRQQPLGAVWCKTRLLNSGGQFDQPCNLFDGAILAQVICASAYDCRRWVSKGPEVCVWVRAYVCTCTCMCTCVCMCTCMCTCVCTCVCHAQRWSCCPAIWILTSPGCAIFVLFICMVLRFYDAGCMGVTW